MKTSNIVWIVIVVVVLIGGFYLFSSPAPVIAPGQPSGAQPAVSVPLVTIGVDAKLGSHLVAVNGMSLYVYAKDTAGISNCSGPCATNWPPYTVVGNTVLKLPAGITGKLATIVRTDTGAMQLTYNGAPLYYYVKDNKPGDVIGENVGNVWKVVKP